MGAIVYHANYLKFIERARSDWVRALGIDQNALREGGLVFAVRRLDARFLSPARLDDVLAVATRPVATGGARIVLHQEVACEGRTLFRAEVELAALDTASGAPRRLPAELRRALG